MFPLFRHHQFNEFENLTPTHCIIKVVYTGAVLSGEYTFWQYCWERYISLRGSPEGTTERLQLLRALGKTKDAWFVFNSIESSSKTIKRPKSKCVKFHLNRFQNRLLSHVITLPPNEVVQVLQAIAGTPTGGAMACRFLQAKWYDLEAKIGAGSVNFAKVISAITQYGATKFDYDEVSPNVLQWFNLFIQFYLILFCSIP